MAKKDYVNAKLDFCKLEISGFMGGFFLMGIGVFTIGDVVLAGLAALGTLFCFVGAVYFKKKYFDIADELNEL